MVSADQYASTEVGGGCGAIDPGDRVFEVLLQVLGRREELGKVGKGEQFLFDVAAAHGFELESDAADEPGEPESADAGSEEFGMLGR